MSGITYPLLKIVSDGTGGGTHILNADGTENEALKYSVAAVRWEVSEADHIARVHLELIGVAVEVEGELRTIDAENFPPAGE